MTYNTQSITGADPMTSPTEADEHTRTPAQTARAHAEGLPDGEVKDALIACAEAWEAAQWRPIETHPRDDKPFAVLLSGGAETICEYWSPPPREIDPEQIGGGLAWMATSFDGKEGDPTHWRPLPETRHE